MAKITRTQRRLVASSIAFVLMAAMMLPTTTDARGGGGVSFGGHGGGAHFGHPGTVRTTANPSIAGPATVRRTFSSSPRHFVSSRKSFSHRNALFSHSHAIGSHFFSLGADGVWVDNFIYAPTVLIAQPPVIVQQQPAQYRASAVRTPNAAQAGIIVVRGDSKSYVTFPSRAPS